MISWGWISETPTPSFADGLQWETADSGFDTADLPNLTSPDMFCCFSGAFFFLHPRAEIPSWSSRFLDDVPYACFLNSCRAPLTFREVIVWSGLVVPVAASDWGRSRLSGCSLNQMTQTPLLPILSTSQEITDAGQGFKFSMALLDKRWLIGSCSLRKWPSSMWPPLALLVNSTF